MTDETVCESVLKFSKLTGADGYVKWRRRMEAHLLQQDFELFGLADPPKASNVARHRRWREGNMKAKSFITITLSSGHLAQKSALVDDDSKTARDCSSECSC